jgi:hypothetical protein
MGVSVAEADAKEMLLFDVKIILNHGRRQCAASKNAMQLDIVPVDHFSHSTSFIG